MNFLFILETIKMKALYINIFRKKWKGSRRCHEVLKLLGGLKRHKEVPGGSERCQEVLKGARRF